MKKNKTHTLKNLKVNFFDGQLGDVISKLQTLVSEYHEFHDLEIETFDDFGEYGIVLIGKKIETDEEFEKRKKREESMFEKNKQHELALLEQLKKKYEGQQ
jgi:hypothetical protein